MRGLLSFVTGVIVALATVSACSDDPERPPLPQGSGGGTDGSGPPNRPPPVDEGGTAGSTADASARDATMGDSGARMDARAPDSSDATPDAAPVDAAPETGARPDSGWYDGPRFVDVTRPAGVSYLQSAVSQPAECGIDVVVGCGMSMTGGVAVGDYDGDDWPDLYVTRIDASDILFRNRGDGTFEDVTVAAGLTFNLPSNGAGWGDVDNDGDLDLFVTTMGDYRYYLFVNENGVFSEQAAVRGTALTNPYPHQGFSIAFGDFDRDGWLDIHTTEWRQRNLVGAEAPSNNRLLRNLGPLSPGFFEDVTEDAGVSLVGVSSAGEWGFASTFSDLDADGFPDLAVASDFLTSRLFWNNGDGTFSDGTRAAQVGTDENGMGSTIGDYDGDGLLDWFVTAIFCNDPECPLGATGNRLYRNNGDRTFRDDTDRAGVRNGRWGWGTSFFDYDNDGDLDLVMTNGVNFAEPEAAVFRSDRMRLWRNDGGAMTEVAFPSGLDDTGDGKGLAVFDYDGDGDLDVFVARHGQSGLLYRNDAPDENAYLRIRPVGTMSNTFGIGTRITVIPAPGSPPIVREVQGGSNYLGQNETIAHFGLGALPGTVHEVRLRWPVTGAETVLTDVTPNRTLVVTEP